MFETTRTGLISYSTNLKLAPAVTKSCSYSALYILVGACEHLAGENNKKKKLEINLGPTHFLRPRGPD